MEMQEEDMGVEEEFVLPTDKFYLHLQFSKYSCRNDQNDLWLFDYIYKINDNQMAPSSGLHFKNKCKPDDNLYNF